MTLRVCYGTHEFDDIDIHLRTLRNKMEFYDKDGVAEKLGISSAAWSLFGIVWPSGLVLAHYLFKYHYQNKRILEVGCGIGLTSLLLNHLKADITATDYHPEVETFLTYNTILNQDLMLPFVRTAWEAPKTGLGAFDLIVGSDLLYEDQHVDSLHAFIIQHSRPQCEVVLVDPGRGRHAKFTKKMVVSGFVLQVSKPDAIAYLDQPFKGAILRYYR